MSLFHKKTEQKTIENQSKKRDFKKIKKHLPLIIIALLIILSLFLRLYNLDQPFGPVQGWNAGHYMTIAKNFNTFGFITPISYENTAHFSVTPLYTWILNAVISVQESELFARLPSVIFGMLSILITYLIANQMYGKKFAMIAAVIFALIPMHVVMSKKVLVDITLLFFMLLSSYLFILFYKKGRLYYLALSSIVLALAILTKQPALGLIPIYFFLLARHKERIKLKSVITIIASVIPFIILGLIEPGFFSSILSEGADLHLFLDQSLIILTYGLSPLILILTIAGIYFSLKTKGWQSEFMVSWFLLYLLFFIVEMPSGHMHYLIPLIPAAALLATKGITETLRHAKPKAKLASFVNPIVYLKYAFIILTFALLIITNFVILTAMYSYDTRFTELRDFMEPQLENSSRIFMISDGGAAPLVSYYLDRSVYTIYPNRTAAITTHEKEPIKFYHFSGITQEILNKVAGYLITSPGAPPEMKLWLHDKKLIKSIQAKPINIWPLTFQPQTINVYEI